MKSKSNNSSEILEYLQRFFKDIGGIALIVFAAISLLGYIGLSQGRLLNAVVDVISQGFGWGTSIFLLFLLYIGILILFRRVESFPELNLKRLLFLEILFFSFLGLVSIFGGNSLIRAADGSDGGVIGWGIAKIMSSIVPLPIASILLFLLALISFLNAFGLVRKIKTSIAEKYSEHDQRTPLEEEQLPLPIQPETSSKPQKQPQQDMQSAPVTKNKVLPPLTILMDPVRINTEEGYIKQNASIIEQTFDEFGIPANIVGYRIGPTVIQYALEPGYIEKPAENGETSKHKIRVSQISSLQRDLALALGAERLRIEAPIPGYSFVGIEVPNRYSNTVRLKSILISEEFKKMNSSLRLPLGLDVSGNAIVADLTKMPHLLIAGTTGSGKSVCISALITGLVMCNMPDDLQLVILDPKRVELSRFNGLPHLIGEVETDPNRMLAVLAWVVAEMERRYKLFEDHAARDIYVYNQKAPRKGLKTLPKIVVVMDELASLMMNAPEQTEGRLVRLAQMARATGIHLMVATQRPSTDIVTGLIKANFPARIAFTVASSVDSRVILDVNGAETLLGRGDMLFLDPENSTPKRVQGVMVDDSEMKALLQYWNSVIPPSADREMDPPWEKFVIDQREGGDALIGKAMAVLREEGRASASLLQRKLRIGYPRAAHLMDELEEMGIVGPPETGGKDREVLLDDDQEDADGYS